MSAATVAKVIQIFTNKESHRPKLSDYESYEVTMMPTSAIIMDWEYNGTEESKKKQTIHPALAIKPKKIHINKNDDSDDENSDDEDDSDDYYNPDERIAIEISCDKLKMYYPSELSKVNYIGSNMWRMYESGFTDRNIVNDLMIAASRLSWATDNKDVTIETMIKNHPAKLSYYYDVSGLLIQSMVLPRKSYDIIWYFTWREIARCFNYLVDIGYPIDMSIIEDDCQVLLNVANMINSNDNEIIRFVNNFMKYHPAKQDHKLLSWMIGYLVYNINDAIKLVDFDYDKELEYTKKMLVYLKDCDTKIEDHYHEIIFSLLGGGNVYNIDGVHDKYVELGLINLGIEIGFKMPDAIISRLENGVIRLDYPLISLSDANMHNIPYVPDAGLNILARFIDRMSLINKYESISRQLPEINQIFDLFIRNTVDIIVDDINNYMSKFEKINSNYNSWNIIIERNTKLNKCLLYNLIKDKSEISYARLYRIVYTACKSLYEPDHIIYINGIYKPDNNLYESKQVEYWNRYEKFITDKSENALKLHKEIFDKFISIELTIPLSYKHEYLLGKLEDRCNQLSTEWKLAKEEVKAFNIERVKLIGKRRYEQAFGSDQAENEHKKLVYNNLCDKDIAEKIADFCTW